MGIYKYELLPHILKDVETVFATFILIEWFNWHPTKVIFHFVDQFRVIDIHDFTYIMPP